MPAPANRHCFNPRPRVGGDPDGHGVFHAEIVSIRAPAWGATLLVAFHDFLVPFQSAPPRGGRLNPNIETLFGKRFNPRPRVGGDLGVPHQLPVGMVSIRAPAWGATSSLPMRHWRRMVSIRAPAWGATRGDGIHAHPLEVSIRAPAWGATQR